MQSINWTDIRYVLAVADTGTLSAASRQLGVNHATVLRRVNRFEEMQEIKIFDRTARGVALAPGRRRLIEAMREMESGAMAVERALLASRTPLAGRVRVTSTDTMCQAVLPPILARLQGQAEGLTLELLASNAHVSLANLDADVTIRPTNNLPPDLVGERAGQLGFAAYAAPGGAARWLGFSGPLTGSVPGQWMAANVDEATYAGRADSFVVLREMVAAGQGRAILPCVLGDGDGRMMRLERDMPDFSVDIWVASHADLAEASHIRAVRQMLVRALTRDAARISGKR